MSEQNSRAGPSDMSKGDPDLTAQVLENWSQQETQVRNHEEAWLLLKIAKGISNTRNRKSTNGFMLPIIGRRRSYTNKTSVVLLVSSISLCQEPGGCAFSSRGGLNEICAYCLYI